MFYDHHAAREGHDTFLDDSKYMGTYVVNPGNSS